MSLIMSASASSFSSTLRIYNSGTSATETIPLGATTCVIEAWGSGGGGTPGTGSGCSASPGFGGAASGYSRTSFSVATQNGKTFTYTVGPANGSNAAGTASSVAAGTVTGFSTMTANGGAVGVSTGAAGGTASGGTAANTTGASVAASTIAGATGTSGAVTGDGSPYGGGGNGGALGAGHPGISGTVGACVFSYS